MGLNFKGVDNYHQDGTWLHADIHGGGKAAESEEGTTSAYAVSRCIHRFWESLITNDISSPNWKRHIHSIRTPTKS